jgi:exosortase
MRQTLAKAWLPILLFTILWAGLIRELGYHWSTNPQYAYGWSVPFLAFFLLWEAWIGRPDPAAPPRGRGWFAGVALCAFCLLPARLFFEATPDWRLPLWGIALAVVGISLGSIWRTGGLPWLRHFAFPVAFILVAVPWPEKIEQPVIQALTAGVTALTVHGLNICGVPAIDRGNLIEIGSGVVGVEEACSGIRSLQSTLMASLFLGQLFAFKRPRRFLLIGIGAVVAFVCNVFRAMILTTVADRLGIAELEKWHDPTGYTILLICFAILTVIALRMKPKVSVGNRRRAGAAPAPLPRPLFFGLAAWVLFVFAGTELWYRSGPHTPGHWWRVEWPAEKSGYAEIPLSSEAGAMQADEARGARWREADGSQFTLFFFRWLPGPASSRMLARFHRPEICLPAEGLRLVRESGLEMLRGGDIELPFRTYLFTENERPVHVFFCIWEDDAEPGKPVAQSWTPGSRLEAVLTRRRNLGQQVLEVGIAGDGTDEEAREEFLRVITPLIRQDKAPGGS